MSIAYRWYVALLQYHLIMLNEIMAVTSCKYQLNIKWFNVYV